MRASFLLVLLILATLPGVQPPLAADIALDSFLQAMQAAEEGRTDQAVALLRAAQQADSMAPEIPRELARILLDARRPEDAAAAARSALALDPGDAETAWILGNALFQSGRAEESIDPFRGAVRAEPRRRAYVVSLLLALETAGRYDDALATLTPERGGYDPDDPYLLLRRGMLRAREGDNRAALGDLVQVLTTAPGYPGATDHLLSICWRIGPSDTTAAACARALDAQPTNTELRHELARILLSLNRLEEARVHLERLSVEEPGDATIPMQLGVLAYGREDLSASISYFRRARTMDPKLPDSLEWLWRSLIRADSSASALSVADAMVREAPKEPRGYWCRALSLARLGKRDLAVEAAEEVLRLDPGDRDARLLAAALLEEAGRREDARLHLEHLLAVHPDDREVLFRLGVLEEQSRRYPEAIQWFRRLLDKNPDDAQALNYVGYMCADQGIELDSALAWTLRATELAPENGAYLDSHGWALYRTGRYGDAVRLLRRATELEPKEIEIWIHLAKAERAAGRADAARGILRRLQQEFPEDGRARDLLILWNKRGPSETDGR